MADATGLGVKRRAALVAFGLLASPLLADAQVSPFSLDAVVAADGDSGSQVPRKATAWIDVFGAVRVADGLDVRARPVVSRRSFDGRWQTQIYEMALRYERPGRIGLRVDAGQFPSPLGLSLLENRPDVNPVISQHSTLYLPVPRYESGTPMTFLLAASYPLGAQVTASGGIWDWRAALTDSSPVRARPMIGAGAQPRMANLIVGGGVTPRTGLRLGAAFSRGGYAGKAEVRDPAAGNRQATVGQVEGEWSFGYTRIAGEWLWTEREMAAGHATVDGGWIEMVQTLSPRVFAAARYDDQYTAWPVSGGERHEVYRRVEATVGWRLAPTVTLRGSYLTRKGYVVSFWDDQVLASVVWPRKFK
jgi:hypothetical protein